MASSDEISALRSDIQELKTILDSAKRDKVKSVLSIELRRWETKLADLLAKEDAKKNGETTPNSSSNASSAQRTYDLVIKNYSWDQSDSFVKIYLTGLNGAKDMNQDAFELKVEKTSVSFRLNGLAGKNMTFAIKETPHSMDTEKSYHKAKSDMVVLYLKKLDSGTKWTHLKKSDKEAAEKPKFTPKNEESADPSANLMSMMKQMYEDGDDEMKRTIAKAWSESSNKRNEMPGMEGMMGGMPGLGDL